MASAIVYDNVAEGADLETGGLFEGKRFWVAQRVPHRSTLLDVIKANGGSIVVLEKKADWMIADHFRKDCPPGTISYDFVHKSIAKGEVQDPNDYPAGPRIGTTRDSGSVSRPTKSTRAHFTPDEDRILYNWAKDAQARGAKVSGNELYRALEEKYPQHPWQSWRDRYVKKLQNMPPAVFNIPDNAPPSPPSDHSSRVAEAPIVEKTALVKNKDKIRTATAQQQPASMGTNASKKQVASEAAATRTTNTEEYTVEQLAATFTADDWEDLYAFVEDIDGCSKEDDSYDQAWTAWAESRDNQTAEQWRQYYEKVVRPQWRRDPVSKRKQIKKKVQERLQDTSSSPAKSQSWNHTQDSIGAASHATPSASEVPSKRTESNVLPSDSGLASESTAQQETPRYIREGYESAIKRIRGELDNVPEARETSRPSKIRRGNSPSPNLAESEEPLEVPGTQEQPLEISSAADSTPSSSEQQQSNETQEREQAAQTADDDEDEDSITSDDDVELVTPIPRPIIPTEETSDLESIASSTDLVHIPPLPRPFSIPEALDDESLNEEGQEEEEEEEDDDDDDNLPTPRAHYTAFDTQAILSPSQSQAANRLSKLPRPDLSSSSPPHHPESDASTTQSLQEFSSYLQDPEGEGTNNPFQLEQETQTQTQTQTQGLGPLSRLPRPASPTPSDTSVASSEGSEDPDEPLTASEMSSFFTSQLAAGYSNAVITAALKRTRCRPGLATAVLEAGGRGEPLPLKRGVWSDEEDEVVMGGNGRALERLVGRHTLDGWGGVTERIRFLEAWARR